MVDSTAWESIYDERIENQIDVGEIRNREDLQRQLKNFFLKPDKKFPQNSGNIENHLDYISKVIWIKRFQFLGIRTQEDFKGRIVFVQNNKTKTYMFKYKQKQNQFTFLRHGQRVKMPRAFFISK